MITNSWAIPNVSGRVLKKKIYSEVSSKGVMINKTNDWWVGEGRRPWATTISPSVPHISFYVFRQTWVPTISLQYHHIWPFNFSWDGPVDMTLMHWVVVFIYDIRKNNPIKDLTHQYLVTANIHATHFIFNSRRNQYPSNKSEEFPQIHQPWWLSLRNFRGISRESFPVFDSSEILEKFPRIGPQD